MVPPLHVKNFAPIDGRHEERKIPEQSIAQQVFNFFRDNLTIFEQADERVGIEDIPASARAERPGHYFSLRRSRSRSSNNASKTDRSPGAGFRNPLISLSRRAVIGVSTSLPFSSLHVAAVPFSSPNC